MRAEPTPDEAIERIDGRLDSGVLFLCDHASSHVPADLGGLGLSEQDLARHIAYDIGAAATARALAARFQAPALLTRVSRLVIDANRGDDDPTLIMQVSDGRIVPGNAGLSEAEKERRLRLYWRPYREAAGRALDAMIRSGSPPAVVSIHSFTPVWKGRARPWQAGVLWDADPRLARPLIEALRRSGAIVGDNEPYDGALRGDTLDCLANARGLASALIELRQDLVGEAEGVAFWTERLAACLGPVLDRPEAHMIKRYPSRNGGARWISPIMTSDDRMIRSEAAAFRRLAAHLRERSDVQNIDLMNLAGFCRNCLSNWLQESAADEGLRLTKDQAREVVYGMPYEQWKAAHQTEATPDQQEAFAAAAAKKAD